jgi:predicted  nucleic acid-binding Zn-ribbon protein
MATEETVQIRCSKCKAKFRDKARRVRSGYSRQCPACECMLFFEDGSPNRDVHEALREAQRVRKILREEEFEKVASRVTRVEQPDGADAEQPDGPDAVPSISRRKIDRRAPSAGRGRR